MTAIVITQLDHLVLTVADIEESVDFYCQVLGLGVSEFTNGRFALTFGQQKINLHQAGKEFEPCARHPLAGSADLCFITSTELRQAMAHIEACAVEIIAGPVKRSGANSPLLSFYFHDPSGNLIEVATPLLS